ncbi:MAG: hypothetical protein RLO17_27115 [Cyclobacteriaceae bacterium]
MQDNIEEIKGAVSDVFSDFYNQVIKKRFDAVDKRLDSMDHKISDFRLTNEAMFKIVDYAHVEARVLELEDRIKRLEAK